MKNKSAKAIQKGLLASGYNARMLAFYLFCTYVHFLIQKHN
jgi:hypothetical protein